MLSGLKNALKRLLGVMGRYFLRRLEMPRPSYEKRIINNLENLYQVIQPGDVLLVEGRSKLSQIIQILTKSSWSHAAFYIGDPLTYQIDRHHLNPLNHIDAIDRRHLMIEADATNGVTMVPLKKYKDFNCYNLIYGSKNN